MGPNSCFTLGGKNPHSETCTTYNTTNVVKAFLTIYDMHKTADILALWKSSLWDGYKIIGYCSVQFQN